MVTSNSNHDLLIINTRVNKQVVFNHSHVATQQISHSFKAKNNTNRKLSDKTFNIHNACLFFQQLFIQRSWAPLLNPWHVVHQSCSQYDRSKLSCASPRRSESELLSAPISQNYALSPMTTWANLDIMYIALKFD